MTSTNPAPIGAHDVDRTISENVTLLIYRKRLSKNRLAMELRVSPSGLSHKLASRRPWTSSEIATLSRFFGVSIDALFKELPHLDSNQEPTGYALSAPESDEPADLGAYRERRGVRPATKRTAGYAAVTSLLG